MSHIDPSFAPHSNRPSTPVAALAIAALALLPLACVPSGDGGGEPPAETPSGPTAGNPEATAQAAEAAAPVRLDLPERFRGLVRAEMVEIEAAMQDELRHLARGESSEGAAVARRIHESFVMKQQLDPEERRELRRLLPDDFLSLDRSFHQKAAAMADAFDQGDFPAAAELHGELTRACVHCHARFAPDRFPELAGGQEP